MIEVSNIETWGFEHALRGMRMPLKSTAKSDSHMGEGGKLFTVGEADVKLMNRLFKAGTEQRKYLRQIFISMDIRAPRYWWIEFDTYKVGVTTNSESTMHTIMSKPITVDDFSAEGIDNYMHRIYFESTVDKLEKMRKEYATTKSPELWKTMIQMLPQSYMQTRTVTMNYENAINMISQRKNHKLSEWRNFTSVLIQLPMMEEIITGGTADAEKIQGNR